VFNLCLEKSRYISESTTVFFFGKVFIDFISATASRQHATLKTNEKESHLQNHTRTTLAFKPSGQSFSHSASSTVGPAPSSDGPSGGGLDPADPAGGAPAA
jgi:hypothetical protein